MLNDNGVIAIADLDIEDGNFHIEDTGVFHFGFERKNSVSYTHLRAHETVLDLVCRLLLEKKKQ